MPQIACSQCGQTYDVTPEQWPQYVGRRITCTKCNQPFDVVDPRAAVRPIPPAPVLPNTGYLPQMPGQMGYGMPPAKKGMSGMVIALIVGGSILVVVLLCGGLFASILIPSLNRAREQANRVKCGANLREIGMALMMYENQNRGAYPAHLSAVLGTRDISPTVFICPDDKSSTPASGATPAALAADFERGGHSSYIYAFENHPPQTDPSLAGNRVIVYEPLTLHGNQDGASFLFADGNVEFVSGDRANALIAGAGK